MGEPLSREDEASYELYQQRLSERYRVGEQADRLVRIVDRYMPRITDENRAYVMRHPHKVGETLQKAWKLRKKMRKRQKEEGSARRKRTGTSDTPEHGEQQEGARRRAEELVATRRAGGGTVLPSGRRDASVSEDTPPDWGEMTMTATATPKPSYQQSEWRRTSQKHNGHGDQRVGPRTGGKVQGTWHKGPTNSPSFLFSFHCLLLIFFSFLEPRRPD